MISTTKSVSESSNVTEELKELGYPMIKKKYSFTQTSINSIEFK